MEYLTKYRIHLVVLGLAISLFIGWFDFITNFKLESFPIASTQNIIAIGLFYLSSEIYRRQVDYD